MNWKVAIHKLSPLPHVGTGMEVAVCRWTNARILSVRWDSVDCPRCLARRKVKS